MRKRIFDSALCLWLLITGCSITGCDNASSRFPNITITNTNSKLVTLKLTDEMLLLGYDIKKQSGDLMFFEKQIPNPTAVPPELDIFHEYPNFRVIYTIHEYDSSVSVYADLYVVERSGSRNEHLSYANQHPEYTSIREVLRQVAYELEN
ncbi:MAG: hypothetical protein ACYS3S_12205 [Planctomycetota bacterium]|jgi:hypothetical protein